MVQVLDKNGQPLSTTNRNGKVRWLLKEKKAKVVNNDPFTIQLLYDIKKENIIMNNNMDIIVISNKDYLPIGISTINTKKMTYNEFSIDDMNKDEIVATSKFYFDIDDLTEDFYNELKSYMNYMDIKFFRYKTKPFIDEYVQLVDIKYNNYREDAINIQLSKDNTTNGHILVNGLSGSGKTRILCNMATQLINKGVDVTYYSIKPLLDKNLNRISDLIQLMSVVTELQQEMMNRYKQMEIENVNNINKLKKPCKPKALIIDDIENVFESNNFRAVDSIKQGLSAIARLGKTANILCIISCQSTNTSHTLSSSLDINLVNRIIVGNIHKNELNINIPDGMGLYKGPGTVYGELNKGIHDMTSSEYTIFNIDDIKQFN